VLILISKIVFILSLLGISFIVIRKIPALSKLSKEPSVKKFLFKTSINWAKKTFKSFISSNFFQNIIIGNLEKSLRKLKILALKLDNLLDKFIRGIKRKL